MTAALRCNKTAGVKGLVMCITIKLQGSKAWLCEFTSMYNNKGVTNTKLILPSPWLLYLQCHAIGICSTDRWDFIQFIEKVFTN